MLDTFRIGEDMVLVLEATRGDVADVAELTAQIALAYRENGPLKGPASAMTVEDRAAEGSVRAGWFVSLTAAQTEDMTPGIYAIDAMAVLEDTGVEMTAQTTYVQLVRSVFG